jgi:hypothetical protein
MGRRKQRAVLRACGELARTAGEGSNQARSSDFGEGHDDPTTDAGTPPIVPKDNLRVAARRIRAATRHREQSDVAVCHKVVKSFALVHRGGSGRRARFYSCSADPGVPQMWPHTAQHQRIKPPRSLILSTSRPPHRVHGGAGDGASPVVDMAIGQKANAMPRGYGFHRR